LTILVRKITNKRKMGRTKEASTIIMPFSFLSSNNFYPPP